MMSGLYVPNPVEVALSLAQDQESNKHLMGGKCVKENQLRPLRVATMHVPLTVYGGHMVNGLHVLNLAEVVTSFAQDQKSDKRLMEGKNV